MAAENSLPLLGKVAIITGSTRGMGRDIAIHLHSLGARVAINFVSSSSQADLLVSKLNASLSLSQPRAIAVQADVSKPDHVKLLFDRTEQEFGSKIHIVVSCAGVLDPKYPTIANTSVEAWDSTFNINTRGTFLVCREAANRLIRGGGGRIILTSSSSLASSPPGYGSYVASKAAVEALVKIVAKELKGTGITANCIAPGPVATEMFFAGKSERTINRLIGNCPLGRLGEPKDITSVVGFLVSEAGEWINGQVIRANGGFAV
ncbi:hypothetical protein ACFE04_024081 [Oxalis oulophora]